MMKNLIILRPLLIILVTTGFLYAFSEITPIHTSGTSSTGKEVTSADPIKGAWLLVWGKYRDNIRNPDKPYQLKLFTEMHYSLLHEQNADQWRGLAGTYELEGNLYKETVLYATDPTYLGITVWWDYEIKNDTLWMTGPVKFFNKDGQEDKEMAGGYNYMREARVRAE